MTQRTALAPSSPAGPSRAIAIKPDQVRPGAQFWLQPAKVEVFDASGTPFPQPIKGMRNVEVTGRMRKNFVEILLSGKRLWVSLDDLVRGLQSNKAPTTAATLSLASSEKVYSGDDVGGVFRVLLQDQNDAWNLRITARVRKALTAACTTILADIGDWEYGPEKMSPASLVASICGNQKTAHETIATMLRDRATVAKSFHSPSRKTSADVRIVDRVLAAAILMASMAKGSTSQRAAFLQQHFPTVLYRAGGSALTKSVLATIRQELPWSEVAKMRSKRGLVASAKQASLTENDLRVINAYSDPGAAMKGPKDLIFAYMRQMGPVRGWANVSNPSEIVHVLTAYPLDAAEKVPSIEKSKQLLDFVVDLSGTLRSYRGLSEITAPQHDGATLIQLFDATVALGIGPVRELASRIQSSAWYRQLMPTSGRLILTDMTPVYSLFTLLKLAEVSLAQTGPERATALIDAIESAKQLNTLTPSIMALRLKNHFTWGVVIAMLDSRTNLG